MKEQIKLSVIIPCYNVERFLDNLFKCINDIDLKSVEFIFINDGSNDFTKSKLVNYVKTNDKCLLINQQNQGSAASRNNGLKIAKGKYIVFIDSDDFIKPNSLKFIVEALEKENADALCIRSKHVSESYNYTNQKLKKFTYKKYYSDKLDHIYVQAMAMKEVYVGSPNMIFKKELLVNLPNYPNLFKDVMGEDARYNLMGLKNSKSILVSKDIYYYYRQRKGSIMHSKFNEKLISILSCNDQLLDEIYSVEVKNHTLARNYLNSIYVLKKMIDSNYHNAINIKYVYSIFKNNRKCLKKAKQFIWPIRIFTPLCTPYFYLRLRSKLK